MRYKATRADGTTQGGMTWEVGKTNRATGEGGLCSSGVLHVYDTPLQASFMIPAHVRGYMRLWEVECEDEGITDGTKRGVRDATPIREIPMPKITTEQSVEIAIRCALTVHSDPTYQRWADDWISGRDRSAEAAWAAEQAAWGRGRRRDRRRGRRRGIAALSWTSSLPYVGADMRTRARG
jgi:hypothetical protein